MRAFKKQLALTAGIIAASLAAAASAKTAHTPGIHLSRPDAANFMAVPGVPACTTIAPLRGDMGKTASTLMVRMKPGCSVPFHWHTPSEEIVLLQGKAQAQMRGEAPYPLKLGSYSQLPGKHVHRFRCQSPKDCILFMVADAPFDIHFVDADGRPISTEQALAAAAADRNARW